MCRDPAISAARVKQRAGTGLSSDSRKKRGLELSPEEEQFVARQVNVYCVCYWRDGIRVCAALVLLTIVTG